MKYLNADDLKIGDKVGITYPVTYGYNRTYKYKIIKEATVTKITPKRTKYVIGGIEFNANEIRNRIVVLDDEAKFSNEMARKYRKCMNLKYALESTKDKFDFLVFRIAKMDDEDLDKVLELFEYLYEKYIVPTKENA